ncbi:hypothetical protein BS636_10425 [Acinetobacter sp. LoGeW2-3]|uniref:hypothetical protein n=1 Tax=Acinetobacter sp. LoGeW2-3 TaxID=1808001 RepID=UPI000C05B541|nr:hypothetical protein [Acinetobacter sp. LoGeW2-3]ATO20041.1 hypothetical protein BS636_10425 [Acinetobacter sp. LoGeW2-3]
MAVAQSTSTYSTTDFMQGLRVQLHHPNAEYNFYVSEALQTINFDNSPESLHRLDQFFLAFKKHLGTLAADFNKSIQKLNTVLLITSQIGHFISSELGCPEHWLSLKELQMMALTPSTEFANSKYYYGLELHGQIVFPIDYVLTHFFSMETQTSISEDVHTFIFNYQHQQANDQHDYSTTFQI